ncbi:MAG: NAD-dependent DNA ligase LigA [Candidatus Shapirobacteria bacterium]|nr:NAD-dependent DNA ligase LigA [Candidatus Shapirobacteria bacterium]
MITLDKLDLQKMSPEEMGELLVEAKKAYYITSKPIMDDHTYDTLEEILRQKSPYHRLFSKVGNQNFDTGFNKKKHTMPMGSQNKVNIYTDLIHYFELKQKAAGDIDMNSISYVVQPKCDGISLEIEYKNGQLVDAITRGDGEIGDVITQNVVKMKNFVPEIKDDFTGSVRCEIVMTFENFKKINDLQNIYSNPRNAASGISQRLDSKYSEYCSLYAVDIYSYNVRAIHESPFSSEIQKIEYLKKHNFVTVDTLCCPKINEVEPIYQKYLTEDRRAYPFEIDGLVIKINDLDLQRKLGFHNNRPKGQVAYKFPSKTNQTRILSVNWQVGPMGTITPVAQVEPIEISGAVITFASLANYQLIKDKNINVGDVVEVSRRGDVIPHIDKVITKVNEGHFLAPTLCPSCDTKLILEDKFLRCPNISSCPAQIFGSLKLFCDALDIKGISDKTIEKLYQASRVRLPGDFYKLKISDFEDLAGLGTKSGTNIVKQIQDKKTLNLKQVLGAAIIPNFSNARIQQIINAGFDTPDKILNITTDQLENLPGVKQTLAQKIYQGIQSRKNFIESILAQVSIKKISQSQKLANQTFVITGSLDHPREEIINEIESLGGKVVSTVSQNTSYLITNETNSNSSKFVTAQKLGTKIINEAEFYDLINQ